MRKFPIRGDNFINKVADSVKVADDTPSVSISSTSGTVFSLEKKGINSRRGSAELDESPQIDSSVMMSGKDLIMIPETYEPDDSRPMSMHEANKPARKDRFEAFMDITKAKEILGWEPKVSREEGLKITYEAFKQLPDDVLYKQEHRDFEGYVRK